MDIVIGNFKTSIYIAKIIIEDKFKLRNISLRHAWCNDIPLSKEKASCICSEFLMEHIPNLAESIKEMYHVLQKGGNMIHVVPSKTDAFIDFFNRNTKILKSEY
jgi:ubiquinone/menaquinone biosynthesis C-methylase UbiE